MENIQKLQRWIKYYWEAVSFVIFLKNWYWIPLMYFFGIRNRVLSLKNGLSFFCVDHMEALTIKEVVFENDYRIKKKRTPMTVIDIGANIGTFSVFAASLNKKNIVYSFEPSTKTYEQLRFNTSINEFTSQITPIKKAVYKKKTKLKLFKTENSGMTSISNFRNTNNFEMVETTTLVDIFKENKIRKCNFMKLDCEGAEYDILFNAPKSIFKKIDEIAMEYHDFEMNNRSFTLAKYLKDLGYKVSLVRHNIENNIGYIYAHY